MKGRRNACPPPYILSRYLVCIRHYVFVKRYVFFSFAIQYILLNNILKLYHSTFNKVIVYIYCFLFICIYKT